MKKRIFIAAGSVLVIIIVIRIILLISSNSEGGAGGFQRPPVAIEADSVRFGPIKEIRQFSGSVSPEYQYVVASKVSGRVLTITKRIGDTVEKGEVLASIDDAEFQQAVREAEANLKIANASLAESQSQFDLARQELERVQSLQKKGIASPSELDAAATNFDAQKSRLKLAEAQVEQRSASLKSAEIRLRYTILTAPEPGFTGERYLDEGSLVAVNAPILSVVGMNKVIVKTAITERDYGRIQPGQHTEVTVDAYPDRSFTGQVARIAPLLQQTSRMAEMEIEVENDSLLLKPGMFARVNVVLDEKARTRIVPSTAVVTRASGKGIFQIDVASKTVQYIPVQTGIVTSELTEIISPDISGLVVTLGHHLLTDGSPVILPESSSGSGNSPPETGTQQ